MATVEISDIRVTGLQNNIVWARDPSLPATSHVTHATLFLYDMTMSGRAKTALADKSHIYRKTIFRRILTTCGRATRLALELGGYADVKRSGYSNRAPDSGDRRGKHPRSQRDGPMADTSYSSESAIAGAKLRHRV